MPHIVLEYSADLAPDVDFPRLLDELHRTLGSIESFETDRIKSRAVKLDQYRVGNERGRRFVHVAVSFSRGRSATLRAGVGKRLLDMLVSTVRPQGIEVSRSVEVRQFEPGMYFNDYDQQLSGVQDK